MKVSLIMIRLSVPWNTIGPTIDSNNGIKSKNNLKLYYKAHEDLENAKTSLCDLEKKMYFHNEDEL